MSLLKKNKSTQISPQNPQQKSIPSLQLQATCSRSQLEAQAPTKQRDHCWESVLEAPSSFRPMWRVKFWRPKGCDCDPPFIWRDVKPPATSTTPGNDHIYPLNRVGKWVSFENWFRHVIVREKRYLSHRTTVELSSTTSQLQDPTWKA